MNTVRSLLLPALTAAALAAGDSSPAGPLVARGEYLVGGVGLCADCHTPRNEKGEFIREHWLLGSALGFQPVAEMPWAPVAPPIAGLPSLTAEQAKRFLMEGVRPDGSRPRPPMPAYRLNAEDAAAVVAYLKSLAPGGAPAVAARD